MLKENGKSKAAVSVDYHVDERDVAAEVVVGESGDVDLHETVCEEEEGEYPHWTERRRGGQAGAHRN